MFYLLAALAGAIAYAVAFKLRRRMRVAIALAVFVVPSVAVTALVIMIGDKARRDSVTVDPTGSPLWVTALIRQQPQLSRTEIEEVAYRGHSAFLVMPGDRAPDSGKAHVLYSEDGHIICEFGGFVGQVTVGSCDIEGIKFIRTIFPQGKR